jgi:hypothetical protein
MNPRHHNRLRNRALAAAATLLAGGLIAERAIDVGSIKPVPQHQSRDYPHRESPKRPLSVPTSIPKDRFTVPAANTPGYDGQFSAIKSPKDFVNIDLVAVYGDVQAQYAIAKKHDGKDPTHVTNPGVPVYVEDPKVGGPVELTLSYIPGTREITGSVQLDLPDDINPRLTPFYAFFDGVRHALVPTFSSPDPAEEPNNLDDISLAIPPGVPIPPFVTG